MSLQLSAQIYLKYDEASNSYYLFCLEDGRHYSLNQTSYEILKMMQEGKNKREIAEIMRKTYNVAIDRCIKDIEDLLDFLSRNKLLNLKRGVTVNEKQDEEG